MSTTADSASPDPPENRSTIPSRDTYDSQAPRLSTTDARKSRRKPRWSRLRAAGEGWAAGGQRAARGERPAAQ